MDSEQKLVYLSSPYSSIEDKELLMKQLMTISGKYMVQNPGHHVVSPLFNHPSLALVPEMGSDYKFWKDYSRNLLKRCDSIIIVRFDGYYESSGVVDEYRFASSLNIPILFLDPDDFI